MKKLFNLFRVCVLALAIGLIISNVTIPSPDTFTPTPEASVCATTEPIKDPLTSKDYN